MSYHHFEPDRQNSRYLRALLLKHQPSLGLLCFISGTFKNLYTKLRKREISVSKKKRKIGLTFKI